MHEGMMETNVVIESLHVDLAFLKVRRVHLKKIV